MEGGNSNVTKTAGILSITYIFQALLFGIPSASTTPQALPKEITTNARNPALISPMEKNIGERSPAIGVITVANWEALAKTDGSEAFLQLPLRFQWLLLQVMSLFSYV